LGSNARLAGRSVVYEPDRPVTVLGAIGEGLAELTLGPGPDAAQLGVGGDAANVCVMAARMGQPARLAGRVGEDGLGSRLLAFWEGRGVDVSGVRSDPEAPTGLYVNEPIPGHRHRFTYWRRDSAGSRVCSDDLGERFFDGLGVLVFTGITLAISRSAALAVRNAIAEARARGARVCCVLNHRPALGGDTNELAELAAASDFLIASLEDVAAVFGGDREVAALGPPEVVLTDGAEPVVGIADGVRSRQPVPPVDERNAAGAGDALAGAYLAARLKGRAPSVGLAWGVAAATLSVQRDGCATSYPSREETMELAGRLPAPELDGEG
jgi:2-dehydro-3-deoxygluconokinase